MFSSPEEGDLALRGRIEKWAEEWGEIGGVGHGISAGVS